MRISAMQAAFERSIMLEISIKELRDQQAQYISRVKAGEES
jgi:hypothetical protein